MDRKTFFKFTAPSHLVMVTLLIFPLAISFWLGLHCMTFRNVRTPEFTGLDNYVDVLNDPKFWQAFVWTLQIIAVTVPAQLVLGFIMAVLLDQVIGRVRSVFLAALILQAVLAIVAVLVALGAFAGRLPVTVQTTGWGIVAVVAVLLVTIPRLLNMAEFYDYFVNSISLASRSGHGLARYAGTASVVIVLAALALRALPRMVFLLPYYWMGQSSGLYDTHFIVVMALVAVNQPFPIWLLRGFFREVARDAALIDGASRLTAFLRVVAPIMQPGIIATSLFTLLLAYHESLLVRILTQSNRTLSVAMAQFIGGFSVAGSISRQSAAAVSATLPIVIVVLIFQKRLVKGLTSGAVKG